MGDACGWMGGGVGREGWWVSWACQKLGQGIIVARAECPCHASILLWSSSSAPSSP
jgi:hypothetical protein